MDEKWSIIRCHFMIVDERSEHCCIGHGNFFSRKVINFVQAEISDFRGLPFDFIIKFSSYPLVEGKLLYRTAQVQRSQKT